MNPPNTSSLWNGGTRREHAKRAMNLAGLEKKGRKRGHQAFNAAHPVPKTIFWVTNNREYDYAT